jgi:acetolactate synthase-1/2/3 large subunit
MPDLLFRCCEGLAPSLVLVTGRELMIMNGAESLVRTALAAGIEVCFANPGTTEMPIVVALDKVQGLRAVLCLFEGVCTGAADGYARMAGKPAMTLLHLGPGFANGIAYLHDGRRARSPIVNVVGEMATWHLAADAPLVSDIASLAKPVSDWVRSNTVAGELAADMAEAIQAASRFPGQIATLIVPHDCQLEKASGPAQPRPIPTPPSVSEHAIASAAELLREKQPAALFLGGHALSERGLKAAARVASVTNCKLICETFPARLERGAHLPPIERLPYFPEQGIAVLANYQAIIIIGTREPVSFFGYPGIPSYLISPRQHSLVLASADEDAAAALEALAEAVGAKASAKQQEAPAQQPPRPVGPISPENLAAAIASVQPEGAIIMDEGNTSSAAYFQISAGAPPFTYLAQPGGAIGLGLPCATGAAIACPDRPVIALQADGSALYTLQSLWTQARESLNVKTVICNNRSYRVLGIELVRAGFKEFGPQTSRMISLLDPTLDWVKLANGMGVPGAKVDTAEALARELERALDQPGPYLIEAML